MYIPDTSPSEKQNENEIARLLAQVEERDRQIKNLSDRMVSAENTAHDRAYEDCQRRYEIQIKQREDELNQLKQQLQPARDEFRPGLSVRKRHRSPLSGPIALIENPG